MALFDGMNFNDPESLGLIQAGAQMMQNSGPSLMPHSLGQILGGGLSSGLQGYQAAQNAQQARAMDLEKLKMLKLQEMRAQGLYDSQKGFLDKLSGVGATAPGISSQTQTSSGGYGVGTTSNGGAAPVSRAQGGGLANMSLDDLGGAAVAGVPGAKELFDIKKYQMDGVERKPGSFYDINGSRQMVADPSKGIGGYDQATNAIIPVSNFAQFTRDNAAAQSGGAEQGKAPFTTQTITPAGGPQILTTTKNILDNINGVGAPPSAAPVGRQGFPTIAPDVQKQRDAEALNYAFQDIGNATSPEGKVQAKKAYDIMVARNKAGQSVISATPIGNSLGIPLQSAAEAEAEKARQVAGVKLATDPSISYANDAAKNLAQKGQALSGQVAESQDLLKRIAESRQALTQFKSGGGADTRVEVAKMLQALPFITVPQDIVDKVANGSLDASQAFQKYSAQEALQTMRQSLASDSGQGSQGNRVAMQLFIKNNPNLDTDPRAIEKIFNFQTKLHNQLLDQQDHYVKYINDPNNPRDVSNFDNSWAHSQIDKGYVNPQIVNGEAKGTVVPAAAPSPYSVIAPNGKTYNFKDQKSMNNFKFEAGMK